MGITALLAAAALVGMTPQQKAALVVVSALPARPDVGGVLVQRWNVDAPRPPEALVFVDQEGGVIRAFRQLPPYRAAADFTGASEAYASGVITARALSRVGVDVDLAPVLDLPDGPLGARQFDSPLFGRRVRARARRRRRRSMCEALSRPGLAARFDGRPALRARGAARTRSLAVPRDRGSADPCVMVGHGVYGALGPRRAVLERSTYELLRGLGFDGVAITDSLDVVGSADQDAWARQALLAGADLLLFTNGRDAASAVDALVPLARLGALDAHVLRALKFRDELGRSP